MLITTRQNAGRSLKGTSANAAGGGKVALLNTGAAELFWTVSGRVKLPAATDRASVIRVSGNASEARSPHEVAAAAAGRPKRIAASKII